MSIGKIFATVLVAALAATPTSAAAEVTNLAQKPGTAASIAAVVGGYLVGAALALPFTRLPAEEVAPAPEPAA